MYRCYRYTWFWPGEDSVTDTVLNVTLCLRFMSAAGLTLAPVAGSTYEGINTGKGCQPSQCTNCAARSC